MGLPEEYPSPERRQKREKEKPTTFAMKQLLQALEFHHSSSMSLSQTERKKLCQIEIEKQLAEVKPRQKDCIIFEVPRSLRKLELDAYLPHVISIGPYHHRKHEHLKEMEKHKRQVLKHFLQRTQLKLESLVELISGLEDDTRSCYNKSVEDFSSQQFVEMMLLDSCFILELLYSYANRSTYKSGWWNLIIHRGFLPFIQRDLLMLENQLPLYLLVVLVTHAWHEAHTTSNSIIATPPPLADKCATTSTSNSNNTTSISTPPPPLSPAAASDWATTSNSTSNITIPPPPANEWASTSGSTNNITIPPADEWIPDLENTTPYEWVANLALKFFQPVIPGVYETPPEYTLNKLPLHLLDIVRQILEPAQPEVHKHEEHNPQLLTHSVTRIRGTGIRLRKKNALKITDIDFDKGKGKLLIPPLRVHGSTKSIFLNLMAFEQCYHREWERYITSYISFMDRLIDSVRDVEYLQKKGIIVHDFGSEDDVATLFNNLRKEIVVPTNTNNYYLANVSCDLNRYYTKWRNWRAILKHEYVKDPWKILSIVAAVLLILLTFAQTIYTILGYYPLRQ
ncbi:hypothetical protein ACSBR2_041719 [Camellia fascicularis]